MLLLGVSQEVAKKETQAFPLGTPRHCRAAGIKTRFDSASKGSASCLANTHGRQRKQGVLLSVFVQNFRKQGCVAHSKNFLHSCLRASSVFASFFNLQTQSLNLLAFAQT